MRLTEPRLKMYSCRNISKGATLHFIAPQIVGTGNEHLWSADLPCVWSYLVGISELWACIIAMPDNFISIISTLQLTASIALAHAHCKVWRHNLGMCQCMASQLAHTCLSMHAIHQYKQTVNVWTPCLLPCFVFQNDMTLEHMELGLYYLFQWIYA